MLDLANADLSINAAEQELALAISHLIIKADKLGIDDSTVLQGNEGNASYANKSIIKFATEIYRVWVALFPEEHSYFVDNTKDEMANEKEVRQLVKQGGYSPTSFPMRFDKLLHVLMPGVKIQDKRFYKPLIKAISELKRSNYA